MTTELTRMAHEIKNGKGDFDGLLLKWSHHVKLDGWTKSKTISHEDAQDLKQEILINVWERFEEYDCQRASFETWAFNRSRSVTRSWIKKEIRRTHPIGKKGYRSESLEYTVVPFEEYYDSPELIQWDYEWYHQFANGLKDLYLNEISMKEKSRKSTEETYEMIVTGMMSREDAMEELNKSRSQIDCDIRRIRKALNLWREEGKEILDMMAIM